MNPNDHMLLLPIDFDDRPTRLAAKTVLVADDTAFVRDRFKVAIEGAGHKAVTAQTGPSCWLRAREGVEMT